MQTKVMEIRKLIEAAKSGDVHILNNFIKDDPLVLRASTLFDGDGPIHVACLGGHVDFVKALLSWSPGSAGETNQDGFSPLHIASADGNIEMVKELLKVGSQLCFVKGRDGKIPLHYAVCKGRKQVIAELLSSSSESLGEVTGRGENCFHLALKNNQFEAFKVLVDFVVVEEKTEIMNKNDGRGNSLLHLAAYGKQFEVFDLLLDNNFHYNGIVENINSLNKSGLTPLDVLLSNGGDSEIEEIIRASGGKRAEEMLAILSPQNSSHNQPHQRQQQQQISEERSKSASGRLIEFFKFNKYSDSPGKVRATLLILAVLMATATYQAVLSPPGGVWQDDFTPNPNSTEKQSPSHSAGKAVMGTKNPLAYGLFLLSNSVGFFVSLHMIYSLTIGIPMHLELRVSLFALTATYDTCMVNLAPSTTIVIMFVTLSVALPIIMTVFTKLVRDYPIWRQRRSSSVSACA